MALLLDHKSSCDALLSLLSSKNKALLKRNVVFLRLEDDSRFNQMYLVACSDVPIHTIAGHRVHRRASL